MFPFVVCAILYVRNKAKTQKVPSGDQLDETVNYCQTRKSELFVDSEIPPVSQSNISQPLSSSQIMGNPLSFSIAPLSQMTPRAVIESIAPLSQVTNPICLQKVTPDSQLENSPSTITSVLFPHLVCLHYYTIEASEHCMWLSHISESSIVLSRTFRTLNSISVVVCEDASDFEFVDSLSLVVLEISTDDPLLLATLYKWAATAR